ncbi:unnamed protein product, partial [Tetraodon nigroviridis]
PQKKSEKATPRKRKLESQAGSERRNPSRKARPPENFAVEEKSEPRTCKSPKTVDVETLLKVNKSLQRKRRSHGVRKSQFDARSVDEITEEDLENIAVPQQRQDLGQGEGQLVSPVQAEDPGHQDHLPQRGLRGGQRSVLRAVSEEPLRGGRPRGAARPELVVPHLPRRVQLQFVSQEGGPLRYGQPGGVGALQRSQQRPHLPGEHSEGAAIKEDADETLLPYSSSTTLKSVVVSNQSVVFLSCAVQ